LARIACFVERYNFSDPREARALDNFRRVSEERGHSFDFMFREDMSGISKYDAMFIRATTDPLFTAYVVSRTAAELGLKVVDDPESIQICGNKIHLYDLFEKHDVARIPTVFVSKDELHHRRFVEVFRTLGKPVVVKAPYTSFSRYVEKVACETSFRDVAKRFLRKSDMLAVQAFMPTSFDWRVGVLNREVLYVCKYMMPKGRWKHGAKLRGKPTFVWGRTFSLRRENAPAALKDLALKACDIIGSGLYGVDIKELADGSYVVVEVNDNPSIYAGYEDSRNKDLYGKIIEYLAG
jgi:glutathione synthase/RimK-type ligase-like ATP-grasp enzyme